MYSTLTSLLREVDGLLRGKVDGLFGSLLIDPDIEWMPVKADINRDNNFSYRLVICLSNNDLCHDLCNKVDNDSLFLPLARQFVKSWDHSQLFTHPNLHL